MRVKGNVVVTTFVVYGGLKMVNSNVARKVSNREFKIRRLRTTNYGWTNVVLCS